MDKGEFMASEKRTISFINKLENLTKIKSLDQVKKAYKSNAQFKLIVYFAMVVFNFIFIFSLFVIIFPEKNKLYIVIIPAILLPIFIYWSLIKTNHKKKNIEKYPSNKIGKYKKSEIIKLFKTVCEPIISNNEERPALYIVDSKKPVAFTVNSLFINFTKRFNALYISENYFNYLTKEELQSLFAHKIAHFRYYFDIFQKEHFNKNIFLALVPVMMIALSTTDDIWELIPALLFLVITLYTFLSKTIFRSYTETDFLSDYYAAVKYGKLPFINMLLSSGRMIEIEAYVKEKLVEKLLEREDVNTSAFEHFYNDIIKSIPVTSMDKKTISREVDKFFRSKKIKSYDYKMPPMDIQSRLDSFLESIPNFENRRERIQWKKFEIEKQDFRISEKEYPFLIKALLDNPRKSLFPFSSKNLKELFNDKHPAVEKRILFIHKNTLVKKQKTKEKL